MPVVLEVYPVEIFVGFWEENPGVSETWGLARGPWVFALRVLAAWLGVYRRGKCRL